MDQLTLTLPKEVQRQIDERSKYRVNDTATSCRKMYRKCVHFIKKQYEQASFEIDPDVNEAYRRIIGELPAVYRDIISYGDVERYRKKRPHFFLRRYQPHKCDRWNVFTHEIALGFPKGDYVTALYLTPGTKYVFSVNGKLTAYSSTKKPKKQVDPACELEEVLARSRELPESLIHEALSQAMKPPEWFMYHQEKEIRIEGYTMQRTVPVQPAIPNKPVITISTTSSDPFYIEFLTVVDDQSAPENWVCWGSPSELITTVRNSIRTWRYYPFDLPGALQTKEILEDSLDYEGDLPEDFFKHCNRKAHLPKYEYLENSQPWLVK